MRKPAAGAAANVYKQRISNEVPAPAPVGGWNVRDPITDMSPLDAPILDNAFPESGKVRLRKGSLRYAYNIGKLQSFTRASSATYFDSTGVMVTVANDVPRFGTARKGTYSNPPPLIVEAASTNYVLWSRDLTNAAWTKSNLTAAKNVTGVDGLANTASRITATAANGTIKQALTMASGCNLTFYVKRITGTGGLDVTLDNGASWSPISDISASDWLAITAGAGGLNPTIGFRIQTSGDVFALDCVQGEVSAATSYIATTSATASRSADTPTYLSGASATVNPADVQTLMEWASGTSKKLVAACNGGLFDITGGGTVGAALSAGYSSNKWSHANQSANLVACNGVDSVIAFNGTSVSNLSITHASLTDDSELSYVDSHRGRLFFIRKNTMEVYYLPIGNIQGAASRLDLSSFFKHGGRLVAIGTWTRDAGNNSDDLICFFTNQGEVLIYSGNDPSSASTWAQVGLFRIAPPIGERPVFKLTQDLVVITSAGFLPLSMVLPADRAGEQKFAISSKINPAVNKAYQSYGSFFGWECLLYARGQMGIFNVPVSATEFHQYVMNITTGAWCRFTGMNARTWAIYNEKPYFGGKNGFVVQADIGNGDDNLASYTGSSAQLSGIVWDVLPAFNYCKDKRRNKHFKQAQPVFGVTGKPTVSVALCTDFEIRSPETQITVGGGGSQWDISPWDVSPWSSGIQLRKVWINTPAEGKAASLRTKIVTNALEIEMYAINYQFEGGQ